MRARRVARITHAGQRSGRPAVVFTRIHAALNRLTRGRLFGSWFGAPVLVLETVGRRSGKVRSVPVLYVREGESFVVMAAAAAARTPAWWLNLRTAGEGVVVLRGRRTAVRVRLPEGAERERLWERYVTTYPAAREYLALTDREMPLVVLEPG